ncbi:MAG TPA: AgmX/PglI C-terminal domain-containing protein [Desulfomonilia bacterium]|nr:AgmX/PglI C-terminal domain-containing protein [Desulfomonilia bacterium]
MIDEKNQVLEKAALKNEYPRRAQVVQVYVFRGEECLGWDCFNKEKVFIGSSHDADLVLSDPSISDIHAVLTVENGNILLSYYQSNEDRETAFNSSETVLVGPLDSIVIGSYTLKTKVTGSEKRDSGLVSISRKINGDQSTAGQSIPDEDVEEPRGHIDQYTLIFEGRVKDDCSLEDVKTNLKSLLKTDDNHIQMLFSGRKVALKKNANLETASKLQRLLEQTGALCTLESSPIQSHSEEIRQNILDHKGHAPDGDHQQELDSPVIDGNRARSWQENSEAPVSTIDLVSKERTIIIRDDEDDEEDEDTCATFSLKDRIRDYDFMQASQGWNRVKEREILLEVVKSRHDTIVDVSFLHAEEKYFIRTNNDLYCLAENKGTGKIYVYVDGKTTEVIPTGELVSHENLLENPSGMKCGVHSRQLSAHEKVILHNGPFEYLLRSVPAGESPKVKDTQIRDREYARHFGRSVVFHVIILIILGMMPTYKPEPISGDKDRFVQVDSKQLEEIRKRIKPPQLPKRAPEIIKLKEQQVAQRITKRHITKAPSHEKTVSAQPEAPRMATVTQSAGSGGGGSAQGEAPTKNVHQAGILSMLGDNIGIKPQEAMAAVTNLDAVSSSAENKAQFKVGGIVGKLDGGRIEIPKAGIVNTKGSSQVMQGGAGGKEVRVAALDKGNTGKNQVKAKVTAQLNKTVKVQGGGMSREEVKRIIDQHLDEITRCYETALVANPSLMGRVVFEWKILMSGKVGEVSIKSSTINSSDIHACIQSSIKSWEFPQPDGSEVIVSYPFIFDIVGF